MKEFAIVLLLALLLNGCSTNQTPAQQAASGVSWESQMSGGIGDSSGFSFLTQFSVGSNGALSITSVNLLNTGTCFGSNGVVTPSGTLDITFNSADQVTGTFSFTLKSMAGDTITLASTDVTGTLNGESSITNGSIVGTWSLAPANNSSCVATFGNFTMTQGTTT